VAFEQRTPLDGKWGNLNGAVDALATVLNSPQFATFPVITGTAQYVPIVLADDTNRVQETVWVTAHTDGSSAVTVVRGREGTAARTWTDGSLWRMAPTYRDLIPAYANRAGLPADGHVGMRAYLLDEGVTVQKTAAGWPSAAWKHGWTQAAGPAPHNTLTVISGLAAVAGSGNIATFAAGALKLNRAGEWSVRLGAYSVYDGNGTSEIRLEWPSGAFFPDSNIVDRRTRMTGYGTLQQSVAWTDYVTKAQADQPITPNVFQANAGSATVNCYYALAATYLGE
jgi:hypothetical protein